MSQPAGQIQARVISDYAAIILEKRLMDAKQRKAIAQNSRLNYLVDCGVSPEEIHRELKRLKIGFIERIIRKRNYGKTTQRG